MSDSVKAYQEAVREYKNARLEASEKIKFIETVSSALRYNPSVFLYRTYSLPTATRDSYQSDRGKFDMSRWPDSDLLRDLLTKWHASFTKLQQIWKAIPAEDRVGLKEPPQKMES